MSTSRIYSPEPPTSPMITIPSNIKSRTAFYTSRTATEFVSQTYLQSKPSYSQKPTTAPSPTIMVSKKPTPGYPNYATGHECTTPSSITSSPVTNAKPLKREQQRRMGYYSHFRY